MDTGALGKIQSNDTTKKLYEALVAKLTAIGPYEVEEKKTSVHLVHGRAFVGVHPRKDGLLLNIVTNEPIENARIRKVEQVSARRFHNEVLVFSPGEIDKELKSWLSDAYRLTTT